MGGNYFYVMTAVFLFSVFMLFSIVAPMDAADKPESKDKQEVKQMEPTRELVFKTINDVELNLYIFEPEDHKATDRRPAIVFFFGGGWNSGTPQQFYHQCEYLASRGMVAISADYRVRSRHGVTPFECVTDGKSAVRWIRANAEKLGIDPDRIAAGGGSAGGHVAACAGVIDGLDESSEDTAISSRPNVLVLFNPALVLARGKSPESEEWQKRMEERFGGREREISPYHHVTPGDPPTIILHGEADTTVPIQTARMFVEAMKKAGNRCELVAYEGLGHGFFNYGRGDAFYDTVREADKFLISLGYLEGSPTIDQLK